MSHLLGPALDLVDQLRDQLDDDVVVTIDPERAATAIAGDSDVVILVGVPSVDWLTWNAHDAATQVYLIATTLDYMRAWRSIDAVLEQLLEEPDLVPETARPAAYRPAPGAAAYPALTLTIKQSRTSD